MLSNIWHWWWYHSDYWWVKCDVNSVQLIWQLLELLHTTISCTQCLIVSVDWAIEDSVWSARWSLLLLMMIVTMEKCSVVSIRHLLMSYHHLFLQLVSSSMTAMHVLTAAVYQCGRSVYQFQWNLSFTQQMVTCTLQLTLFQAFIVEGRQHCIQTFRHKYTIFLNDQQAGNAFFITSLCKFIGF